MLINRLPAVMPCALAYIASLFCILPSSAQDRGLSVIAKTVVGSDDFDVGRQYAVIIGIDKYDEWPSLRSAAAEARNVRRVLAERYYIDEFLELYDKDATASGIRRLFLDVLPRKVGLNDSLLIFYAGHGYLDDSKTGFWIASDGTKDVYSQQGWIPNAQLRNYIAGLKVQRVLLIADACFSGDFLNVTRGAGPTVDTAYFRKALRLTARQVLTSGASETVPDESEFGRQLVSLLERNTESVLDPHTMFDRIRRGVTKSEPLIGTIPGNETGAAFALFLRPTTGSMRVSVATAAEVYVDGALAGQVAPDKPLALADLPAGERRIEARYSGHAEERRVAVVAGASAEAAFGWKPPTTGGLALRGFPEGSTLYLNGAVAGDIGRSGLTLDGLAPGAYKARIRYGLWPEAPEYTTVIDAGKTAELRFAGGSLVVSGLPKGVSVYLGDAFLASASRPDESLTVGMFPTGTYALRFTGAGWEPVTVMVFVPVGRDVVCVPRMEPARAAATSVPSPAQVPSPSSAGSAAPIPGLSVPAGKGILSVTSDPPGIMVHVDDDRFEKTPFVFELTPGTHRVHPQQSFVVDRYYVEQPMELVTVPDGGTLTMHLKTRQGMGVVDLSMVPPGYAVFSGDERLGVAPIGRKNFPAGTVRLRFERYAEPAKSHTLVLYPDTVMRVPWGSVPNLAVRLEKRTIDLRKLQTWEGIPPVYAPAVPLRATAGLLKQDRIGITKVYMCRDDHYLYWRIDFDGSNPLKKPPKGTKKSIVTQLSVDIGPRKHLNMGLEYKVAKGDTGSFIGIWSGEWQHLGDDVITSHRDDSTLVQRIPLDKIRRHFNDDAQQVVIELAHDTGSDWEYGSIKTPVMYIQLTD